MTDQVQAVMDLLKSERQWLRAHRITYAQGRLKGATSQDDRNFWRAVLKALEK